jgi:hypothetical protein
MAITEGILVAEATAVTVLSVKFPNASLNGVESLVTMISDVPLTCPASGQSIFWWFGLRLARLLATAAIPVRNCSVANAIAKSRCDRDDICPSAWHVALRG